MTPAALLESWTLSRSSNDTGVPAHPRPSMLTKATLWSCRWETYPADGMTSTASRATPSCRSAFSFESRFDAPCSRRFRKSSLPPMLSW